MEWVWSSHLAVNETSRIYYIFDFSGEPIGAGPDVNLALNGTQRYAVKESSVTLVDQNK